MTGYQLHPIAVFSVFLSFISELKTILQVVLAHSSKTGPLSTAEGLFTALAEMQSDIQKVVPPTVFMEVAPLIIVVVLDDSETSEIILRVNN